MHRKTLATGIILLFIGLAVAPSINAVLPASTFYVDDDYDPSTPGWNVTHFSTIQGAIGAVSNGDTIIVYSGDYLEQTTINNQITIIGEKTDSEPLPTIHGSSGTLMEINTQGCIIETINFNSPTGINNPLFAYGIKIKASNTKIDSCNFTNVRVGIVSEGYSDITIINANITSSEGDRAIRIIDSADAQILDCFIQGYYIGFELENINGTSLMNNTIGFCSSYGIDLFNLDIQASIITIHNNINFN